MTILKHYNWEHSIKFNDGSITHLFIENPRTYREYVLELIKQYQGEDGNFVLSKDNKEIPISKSLNIITDPLDFLFEEKKINTKINKDLLIEVQSAALQQNSYKLISEIECYAETIKETSPHYIDFDPIDESKILKMLNFHICLEYENTATRILEYLNTSNDVLNIQNFIILNTTLYFTKEELSQLESECSSLKHNVLFIDSRNIYNAQNSIIIDYENCEIY